MLPRLRLSAAGAAAMSRLVARAPPLAPHLPRYLSTPSSSLIFPTKLAATDPPPAFLPRFYASWRRPGCATGFFGGCFASLRGFRKARRRPAAKKQPPPKERQLELDVKICLEEELPDDPEVLVSSFFFVSF